MTDTAAGGALDGLFDGVLELTRALVRIPSVHDPARGLNEQPAADLVVATMRSWGWEPVVELVASGRPNVHAVVDGGLPGPTLLFEGHTDVVTEGDLSAWTVDPFGGELRDGRLYGRGAADMKGGLAAMLYAVRALQLAGPFPGRVKVACLVDEEGMMLGAKHFVAAGHAADCDGAIVCEPEAEEVCPVAKGALRLRVDAHGAMAHGAMPHHGRNPNPALARLTDWLAGYQAELQRIHGEHPQLGWPYATVTVVRGGEPEQLNVIPASAWLAVDVRTVPGMDHAGIVTDIAKAAAELAAVDQVSTEVTVVDDRPAADTPVSDPVVQAVIAAHREVTGAEPVIGGVPGATDGTILWRDAGLPVVVYGPGGKWIAHQADEYVEADDLVRKARVYLAAARRFLTVGSG